MEEEKRLELRLGPPGDQFTCNNGGKRRTFQNSWSSSPPNKETCPIPNKRGEVSPVVGWPPVRSFRRNLAGISGSPKQAPPEKDQSEEKKRESEMYVKVNMEGVPIGRKVNLSAFTDYHQLSTTVDHLFSGLLAIQMGSTGDGNNNEEKTKDLNRQYTLVYEDTEGDRVLVGDIPWEMFVSTVKRLHVLKTSEVSSLSPSKHCQERGPPT